MNHGTKTENDILLFYALDIDKDPTRGFWILISMFVYLTLD